jgi:hypothetical protein
MEIVLKKFIKLFILLILSSGTIASMDKQLKPENVDIYSDIDEVLIESSYSTYKLILGGIALNPFNTLAYLYSLLKVQQAYAYDKDGIKEALYDKRGDAIEGITFHFLYHGMEDTNLTHYVPWLIETLENSRQFIPGTRKIYKYLKKAKGYNIDFVTNKDRISYDLTVKSFGHKFSQIPSKVFVAHPGNSTALLNDIQLFADRPITPNNYKQLVNETMNIQESDNIIHLPGKKPEPAFYERMIAHSKTKKNITCMIFIDDKKTNVDAFNKLQPTTDLTLHGILFKNPAQLAEELTALGILSQEDDCKLFEKL